MHFYSMISVSNEHQWTNIVVCFIPRKKTKWQPREKVSQNWMKCHIFSCFCRLFFFLYCQCLHACSEIMLRSPSFPLPHQMIKFNVFKTYHSSSINIFFSFLLRCFLKSEHQSNYVIKTIYNFVPTRKKTKRLFYDFKEKKNSFWLSLSWINWFL